MLTRRFSKWVLCIIWKEEKVEVSLTPKLCLFFHWKESTLDVFKSNYAFYLSLAKTFGSWIWGNSSHAQNMLLKNNDCSNVGFVRMQKKNESVARKRKQFSLCLSFFVVSLLSDFTLKLKYGVCFFGLQTKRVAFYTGFNSVLLCHTAFVCLFC